MKQFNYLPTLSLINSCDKDAYNDKCIDESLIDINSACTVEYAPVCECNDTPYPDSCEADVGGVVMHS